MSAERFGAAALERSSPCVCRPGLVGLSFRKTVDESDYVVSVLDALERLRVKYAATSPRSESTEDASVLYA